MFRQLGYSVYLANYHEIKTQLIQVYEPGSYIFTSFHISEEMGPSYVEQMKSMCRQLHEIGYKIIGDVSKKTLKQFGCETLWEFAEMMEISMVRIDYGFSDEEIIGLGKRMPVCINASAVDETSVQKIRKEVKSVYGIHNFYPRPETGLDEEYFTEINRQLRKLGMKVMAFIPGDIFLRGPLFEGLPTLEKHRGIAPFAAYVDAKLTCGMDEVLVGDGVISQFDGDRIKAFEKEGVLELPVVFSEFHKTLYGKIFTIRTDSPRWVKRLTESREYSCFGTEILPADCTVRDAGSITMDNSRYLRYSGEIQMVIEKLPADERVNVIGRIEKNYELLLMNIRNGQKIRFVEKGE